MLLGQANASLVEHEVHREHNERQVMREGQHGRHLLANVGGD
jgi:hypothetical protein